MIPGPVSTGSLHWDIVELFGGVSHLPRAGFLGPAKGHGCVEVLREGQLESWAPGGGQEDSRSPTPGGSSPVTVRYPSRVPASGGHSGEQRVH